MKNVCGIYLLAVLLIFGFAAGALSQEKTISDPPLAKQDQQNVRISTEGLKTDSEIFWENLDLLNPAKMERSEENNKLRTFPLYPQSFSAVKPEPFQQAPAVSYFLSFSDPDKENSYVGLANIGGKNRTELNRLYQDNNNLDTELLVGYQWSGIGSILFGRAMQLHESPGENYGRVMDMGWRFKFLKTF